MREFLAVCLVVAMTAGWKDTVRADSRMVTRIIVPFTRFTGRYVCTATSWNTRITK